MGVDPDEKPPESNIELFKGVTYYVVGEISSEVMSLLEKHGAKRDSYLSEMVSHVIAENTTSDDYSEAKELFELPIVTSEWVILSVRCGKQLPKEAFALEGRLFSKVVACPSDLETEEDVLAVWGMIVYHGGKCQLDLDEQVTHLITTGTESPKYSEALHHSETIKIVTPDWVQDTVEKKEAQNEAIYHPKLIEIPKPESPEPEPEVLPEAMETSPGNASPNSLQVPSASGQSDQVSGDERMEIPGPDAPNAKEALARKISSRIYSKVSSEPSTPEKNVPSMFHPSGSPGVAPGVRITSPVPAMGLQPRMDGSPNIRNTLRNITNRAATPHNVPLRSSLPTGASKINPVLNMGMPHQTRPPPPDYPFPRMPGPMQTPISTTPAQTAQATTSSTSSGASSGPQYFGHDPKETVPTNACLLGCVFLIVDYQNIVGTGEITSWKKVIEQHGGQVESSYCHRVTHIMCSNQKSEVFKMALKEGKRVVTAFWLNDCLMLKKMSPPWQALHLPLSFNSEKPGFNQMISVTNFDGEERSRLKQMINAIGAKYTGYMTHHNSALICKKPGGMKFEKAKEWRIAVVNVQWLSDLVLGHMEALRLPVHVRYLQVGQGREFHMDLNRVSHLLGGWKSPVKISKETRKKYGSGLLPTLGQENSFSPSPSKRRKVDCSTPAPEVEGCVPKVLFTLYPKSVVTRLTSIVKQLGGVVVSNPRHCTHLVCPKLARTIKFFIAISSTRHIVSKEWLEESVVQERFLAEGNYALKDEKGESDLGCDIVESIRLAQSRPLFQNITFYITPGVVPPVSELTSIIENAGGIVAKKRPSAKSIASEEKSKFIVITCLSDLHLSQDLRGKQIPIYNSELILTGVMRQELNLNMFRIAAS